MATILMAMTFSSDYIIQGKILDENDEPVIAANILIKGTTIGTTTDFDGNFQLKSPTKSCEVEVSYIGYPTKICMIHFNKKNILKLEENAGINLDEVIVKEYKVPLATQHNTTSGQTITSEQIRNLPTRNVGTVSAKAAGASDVATMKSSRSGATDYYIDGVRVRKKKRGKLFRKNKIAPNHPIDPKPEPNPQWNTEDYSAIHENRFQEVTKAPLSTFSIDVDAASYSNMRRFINNGQKPPADAVRIEEMVNYFNYEYPQPTGEDPFALVSEVAACPWNPDHQLLHVGLQGLKIATEDLPASNLVFLIDVSGSMGSPNKLPLLQSSYKMLADQLREQDRVAIVVYAGAAGVVLPSTSGADKQTIKAAIDKLRSGGSTAGSAGIKLAYEIAQQNFIKEGNNRVILATDGDFNIGQSSDAHLVRMIEEKRESGVFLTVMGFGMGNYKDNKMQQLANKGNGNHAYIDNITEAKKVLVSEFGGTMHTIAKDVKFQIEFNPAKVQGYRLIGYENRMLATEDFNDDTKDAGELGSGHTVTALYELIPTGVKTKAFSKVDDLKYQKKEKVRKNNSSSEELLTLKLRYKTPQGKTSKKIERPLLNLISEETSDNFRWSAAVAQFGLLLRNSEYKGNSSYEDAITLAKSAKGNDPNGYRHELIHLMEAMELMDTEEVAQGK